MVHLAFETSVYFIATPRTILDLVTFMMSAILITTHSDWVLLLMLVSFICILVFLALPFAPLHSVVTSAFITFTVITYFFRIVFLPNVVGLVFSPYVCVI